MTLIEKFLTFLLTGFMSLWDSAGWFGRVFLSPFGLALILLLNLVRLVKNTFVWFFRLIKLGLHETKEILYICSKLLNTSNASLDEIIENRIFYHIRRLVNDILNLEFTEAKEKLTAGWFSAVFFLPVVALGLFIYAGVFFCISFYTFYYDFLMVTNRIPFDLTASLLMRMTLFTPILMKILRQLITEHELVLPMEDEFWVYQSNEQKISFNPNHIKYIFVTLAILPIIYGGLWVYRGKPPTIPFFNEKSTTAIIHSPVKGRPSPTPTKPPAKSKRPTASAKPPARSKASTSLSKPPAKGHRTAASPRPSARDKRFISPLTNGKPSKTKPLVE